MTNYRWTICAMLFFATTVNYLDRQVLSLTWDEFIKPEFHWDESHYGTITSVFSIVYAICMLFAGRFVDWMGTKKGFLWAIGVWSAGACLHAVCGIVLGFIWMGFWVFMYDAPSKSKHVNQAELDYIEQDNREAGSAPMTDEKDEKRMKFWQCFSYKQTWAFVFGKFMTDGVWWFFLFWTPSYLNTQFGIKTSDPLGMALIFTLYAVTMLSIYGGKLPTIFINRTGMNPYAARMKAMLIFAFFPLVVLLAQPLGTVSPWFPVILIGIGGAAHQSWSANIFSTVGDMFPRTAIASITGIGGMAGGVGSMILQKVAGNLFVYASGTTMAWLGHHEGISSEIQTYRIGLIPFQ